MPPSLHAVLGASSAHRWLACPPSARLDEKLKSRFGERSSEYAKEGTKAHALGELKIRRACKEINEFNYTEQRKQLGDIPKEMEQATDSYCDVIMQKFYEAQRSSPDAQLLLETHLDYSRWVPSGFGTGDALIISDGMLEICDLKYGKGIPVFAENNPQIRLYALGAIDAFEALYSCSKIRMTIIQPRLDSVTEDNMTKADLLKWAENEVTEKAQLAWQGRGEFSPGDHCRFCAARAICWARASEALKMFNQGLDAPDVIPDNMIPEILKVADDAEKWLKDVREYALSQAELGQQFEGFKLVHGKKPSRTWVSEETVKEQLIRAGYEPEQYEVTKLRPVGDLEKTIGKSAFRAIVGQFVSQGEGKLTLVPEDDRRIEFSSADADFSDITTLQNDEGEMKNE